MVRPHHNASIAAVPKAINTASKSIPLFIVNPGPALNGLCDVPNDT